MRKPKTKKIRKTDPALFSNMWLDRQMREILEDVAEKNKKHKIKFEALVEIVNIVFGCVAFCISSAMMPKIIFRGSLGAFGASASALRRKINGKNKFNQDLEPYKEVYERVINEDKLMSDTKSGRLKNKNKEE